MAKTKHICSPAAIRKLAFALLSFAETVDKLNGPKDDEDVAVLVQINDKIHLVKGWNEDDRNFHFYIEVGGGSPDEREGINLEED